MQKKVFSFIKVKIHRRMIDRKRAEMKRVSWGKVFGWGLSVCATLFALSVLGFSAAIWILGSDLPDVNDLTNFVTSQSTLIYDREGNVLYTVHGEENRENIVLSDIPKHYIDATIAIEDDQFYSHPGFDLGGILKAVLYEVTSIGNPRGGSTITQQLVKNVFLTPERSYVRKAKELILAMRLEQALTKDEILELYLNRIPYGSNAYGVQMAAKTFFNKNAKDLSLLESSIIASLPKAPSWLSPYGPNKAKLTGYWDESGNYISGRKDIVLDRMLELGYITEKQKLQAQGELKSLEFEKYRENIKYPHFVFYVREILENKFGDLGVEAGGLKVYTTIDPKVQDFAEKTIQERKERNLTNYAASNMALLTVDATNGQILAMVGSVDYFDDTIDGNVNVVTRPRSPGSSFKPFVYAAAFLAGYAPSTLLFDVETDFGNNYKPKNFDGTFNGPVSARKSLGYSLNIPAIKMAFLAGIDNVIRVARDCGATSLVDDPDLYGISIGLGTGEVPLIEMVRAYTTLARGGSRIDFNPILRIEDSRGNVIENLENVKTRSEQVLDQQIAYSVTHVLSDGTARPEAWGALNMPGRIYAVKTGTSNRVINEGAANETIKPGDVWTLGYTTRVVTGVWGGNNDNSPMSYSSSGVSVAAPVWNAVMTKATEDYPVEPFPVPEGIEEIKVAKLSGKLPSEFTPEEEIVTEIFTQYNKPTEVDDVYAEIPVDGVSGKLPTDFTPESAIENAVLLNFHSEKPDFPNWEKPVQEWVDEHYFDKRFLKEIPTEYDDVHNEQTGKILPSIRILSPSDNGIVSFGKIGVVVEVDSKRDVRRVEYYLGDKLVDTQRKTPFRASFSVAKEDISPQKIALTAKVLDNLLYADSDSVTIDLGGKDTRSPEISFVFPQNGSRIPVGSVAALRVSAFDREGDVQKVTYFLGSQEVGSSSEPPFIFSTILGDVPGELSLKAVAFDQSGNQATTQISITLEESVIFEPTTVVLLEPRSNDIVNVNETVFLFGKVSSGLAGKVQKAEFIARDKSGGVSAGRVVVGEVSGSGDGTTFVSAWIPKNSSEYDLVFKVYLSDEQTLISGKVPVTVR